jgi:glutamate synthase (NADPH/NADH) large chain/glutamate synthase (ferredoxin)
MALTCVANLTHRGAVAADAKSGDGAGVLAQLPYGLLRSDLAARGVRLAQDSDLAVGMVFLPGRDSAAAERSRDFIEQSAARYGLRFFGWRPVPVESSALGEHAMATQPAIEQALFGRPEGMPDEAYSRALYMVRKDAEALALENGIRDLYICSLSNRTIVYKGLMVAPQLPEFYSDLRNPDFQTSLAVFHQRYSTNTFPSWELAQLFRFLAHNGEINTLRQQELDCRPGA